MACPALQLDGAFVGGTFDFIDCQARTIGAGGYQALAAPGSIVSIALTGLLTLFVAGYGFRMLTGETPALRDGVTASVKIGFVLALATAWAPYRTLVYDVVIAGPAELAATIGGSADLPGTGGDLAQRLDLVDDALIQLGDLGVGRQRPGQQDMQNRQVAGSNQVVVEPVQGQPNPIEPYAFGLARIFFLVGAIGAVGAARLGAGLLLALGPLFVAFALFDATRGLFEGWVRGLAGAFLATLAASVLLASELALVEDWIADLLTQRLANAPIIGAPIELIVVTLGFDIVLIAGLGVAVRVAAGFRLPSWRRPVDGVVRAEPAAPSVRTAVTDAGPGQPRSRALAVADGIAALQRREAAAGEAARQRTVADGGVTRATIVAGGAGGRPAPGSGTTVAAIPLGHSFQRRARTRTSTSAGRRDTRS